MSIIEVRNISKSYGSHKVLDNVSLNIHQPGIVALVGPNGVGKTTLLNIITNLIHPNEGEVQILGHTNRHHNVFKQVSYLIDNRVLYHYLSGWDHLIYVSESRHLSKKALQQAIELFDISSFVHKKVQDYSLGMKQQLLFTMALMGEPEVIIMDEPFNGLDPSNIIRVRRILKESAARNQTILLSSHNLAEVDKLTSDIIFVKDGQLIREDISTYQSNVYLVKVKQPEETIHQLPSAVFLIENGRIIFQANDEQVGERVALIMNQSEILDIAKEMRGAERRYNELYGNV